MRAPDVQRLGDTQGFGGTAVLTRQQGRSPFSSKDASNKAGKNSSKPSAEQEDAYFTELLSYSLERLGKEPELLRTDQDHLKRQAEESAIKHYKAFISTASSLQTAREEVQSLAGHVESLLEEIPVLDRVCTEFTATAKTLQTKQAENKHLQSNHAAMLELLEVPQLMDTCVRNGSYDDALDLKGFIGKLAFMHTDLVVVQSLVKEVDDASQSMLEQLLQKLRSNVQLPDCLRIIGYLRRLGVFSERDLRLQFLQCREEWLAEVIQDLEEQSVYDYLKRLTDMHRLHLFDVVMQYRAIFSDDSSLQEGEQDGGLVFSWTEHRVCLYLEALRGHLPRITEGGSLASVLEHCMYCGMSLARVGLDIRGLLPPIFEACVLGLFSKAVSNAVEAYLVVLDTHKWTSLPSAASRSRARTSSSELSAAEAQQGSSKAAPPQTASWGPNDDPSSPPYALMEHPPLAIFINGMLAAFNELRHCAPLSLAPAIASLLQEALQQVCNATAHYSSARTFSQTEQPLLQAAVKTLVNVVVPLNASCFQRIYPEAAAQVDVQSATKSLQEVVQTWEREQVQQPDAETTKVSGRKQTRLTTRPPVAASTTGSESVQTGVEKQAPSQ